MAKIFFVGGLPRAGSTLIMNLLGQNPDFSVSATSGATDMLFNMRQWFTTSGEVIAQDAEEMNERFKSALKGALIGWGNHAKDTPVYIDKSRGWIENFATLETILGEPPKIIVPVRDLRGAVSSMEKLFRANTLRIDPVYKPGQLQGITMQDRVVRWMSGIPLGVAIDRIHDTFTRGVAKQMLFVRMENLCSDPAKEMARIYEYLGETPYEHHFTDIEQLTIEDDRVYGIPNLHKVQPRIEPIKEDWLEILNRETSTALVRNNAWYYERFYPDRAIR